MKKFTVYSLQFTADKKGTVLILTFITMAALTAITTSFLSLTSIQTKGSGYDIVSSKALWLAEAGLQKAIWNLKTPVGSGGQGEDWTTTGTTENLGNGSYTMVVMRWDFVLATNGASASASSEQGGHRAEKAIDGNNATYWESSQAPSIIQPEYITITFPYTLTINKVSFYISPSFPDYRPMDYTWEVSTSGTSWTTVITVTNNTQTERTDTFSAVPNVNYLRLSVTRTGGITNRVRVYTLEAIGSKVTSTGSVDILNRKIEQTIVADDATQTASNEIDWNEIIPAT